MLHTQRRCKKIWSLLMSECKYCGGDCHEQVLKNGEPRAEFLCDGYAGDIDKLYEDNVGEIKWD